jgi:hypothetical protein
MFVGSDGIYFISSDSDQWYAQDNSDTWTY